MARTFSETMPTVGQIVRVTIESTDGGFVMDARVRFRYANPIDKNIVLDVTDTPSSTLPVKLEYLGDDWIVKGPEKCPFFNRLAKIEILEQVQPFHQAIPATPNGVSLWKHVFNAEISGKDPDAIVLMAREADYPMFVFTGDLYRVPEDQVAKPLSQPLGVNIYDLYPEP